MCQRQTHKRVQSLMTASSCDIYKGAPSQIRIRIVLHKLNLKSLVPIEIQLETCSAIEIQLETCSEPQAGPWGSRPSARHLQPGCPGQIKIFRRNHVKAKTKTNPRSGGLESVNDSVTPGWCARRTQIVTPNHVPCRTEASAASV